MERKKEEGRINPPSVITARFVPLTRAEKVHRGCLGSERRKGLPGGAGEIQTKKGLKQ
jgi:hypothetical protein